MTEPAAVEITRSDLDKHIEETVAKSVGKSLSQFNENIDALRKELSGPERAEQVAAARDKSAKDFAALNPEQRTTRVRQARSALFNRSLIASEVPDDLREIGWGKGDLFTRFMLLKIRAEKHVGKGQRATEYMVELATEAGHMDLVNIIENRTLLAGDAGGAGALIPDAFSTDFIAALYAAAVVRRAGAVVLDISERGNMSIGRQNTSATAAWVGEGAPIGASQGTYGNLKLDAKKLGVFVPVSNDAIRYASGQFNALVAQDMIQVAALKEDIAFIRGDGTAGAPKGIRNWLAAGQGFAQTTGGTAFANTTTDLIKLQYKVEGADIPLVSPAFLMSTRDKFGLMQVATGDGSQLAFMAELVMNDSVMGVPAFATTAIPKTLGGGTESELYYSEMSQCIIGDAVNVEVSESESAGYLDSNSVQQNTFQNDERVIKLIHEVDFVLRHDKAAAYINNSTIGAALDA